MGSRVLGFTISMIAWIRTSRLSIKNSLSFGVYEVFEETKHFDMVVEQLHVRHHARVPLPL